jgi:hypothetical protein
VSRQPFAHDAVLEMDAGADDRAPGGAITVALCGSWEHRPPCPLAPHHTAAERAGKQLRLRVLFAAEPDDEPRVRALIDGTLADGSGWRLASTAPSEVRPVERAHAERLTRS